jgi:hypothetical protein
LVVVGAAAATKNMHPRVVALPRRATLSTLPRCDHALSDASDVCLDLCQASIDFAIAPLGLTGDGIHLGETTADLVAQGRRVFSCNRSAASNPASRRRVASERPTGNVLRIVFHEALAVK